MFLMFYRSTTKYLRYFQRAFRNSSPCIGVPIGTKKTKHFRYFRLFLLVVTFSFGFLLLYPTGYNNQRLFVQALKTLIYKDQEITGLKFLINPTEKCQKRTPFLVLLVTGQCHDVKARDTIRKTWGNENNYGDIDVMRIFLVGVSPVMTGAINRLLEEESALYGDIVQQDFLDTYNNLTLKTLMGMEWVTKFCPSASYVMKVDDDVFLNVNYIVHQLLHPELPPFTNYVTGYILENTAPNRHNHSKWYLPEEVYPSKIFPPYPLGAGYILSVDVAKKIYDVAKEILVFHVEDAFVGVCLSKMNISITPAPKNVFHGVKLEYEYANFTDLILVHNYKNEDLLIVWSHFLNVTKNTTSPARLHPPVTPYPYPYKFLINPTEKCQKRTPFLVLLVTGECHDVKARDIIRKTWGDENNYGDIDVMRIFLVGVSPVMTGAINRLLEEESALYGDIVQQDFLDTYSNLTLKTLMGMEWVTKFCPNASYVMKVDTDVFLNVNYLVHQLLHPELPPLTNYVTGYIVENTSPNSQNHSKWYLPEEVYPSKIFPTYPAGPGYILSVDVAKKVYDVAQEILVFHVEDAFVGVCLSKMNISLTPAPKNAFHRQQLVYQYKTFTDLVLVHNYKNEDLLIVWSQFWNVSDTGDETKIPMTPYGGNWTTPSINTTKAQGHHSDPFRSMNQSGFW